MDDTSKDAQSQHERFVETARNLGCDEDEAAFDEKLKTIVTHKPASKPAPAIRPPRKAS